MKIVLVNIRSDDGRTTAELAPDEVVKHCVELHLDGRHRTFDVYLRANVLSHLDASVLYGDSLLEELLRFEPEALSKLYATVGKHRRGLEVVLPLVLADTTDARLDERRA